MLELCSLSCRILVKERMRESESEKTREKAGKNRERHPERDTQKHITSCLHVTSVLGGSQRVRRCVIEREIDRDIER